MAKKLLRSKEYSYSVIYELAPEGGYQIIVPLLPGLISYGRNLEEARAMARDAIICHLESLFKRKERIPRETNIVQERLTVSL